MRKAPDDQAAFWHDARGMSRLVTPPAISAVSIEEPHRAAIGDLRAFQLLGWFDPVTSVGFVEPMRTEEDHQRRGPARHLSLSGRERLAALGAVRLKVNYEIGNRGAERLISARVSSRSQPTPACPTPGVGGVNANRSGGPCARCEH